MVALIVEAVGVAGTPVVAAEPAPTPPVEAQTETPSAPVEVADLAAATEDVTSRTAASRTFRLADGRTATEVFSDPIFYRPDGPASAYVPIELGFVESPADDGSVVSARAPTKVTVAAGTTCSATTSTGSVTYEYDANDNRTRVVEDNGATSTDRRYCYDAQDRLEYRNTGAACSASTFDEKNAYDASGNRTQTVVGVTTTNFAYDATGQLCQTGAATCGTPNVTYDPSGRTATWNNWSFTYDAEGRLLTACKSPTCAATADKVSMTYDGEGRRTSIATRPANQAEVVREFRYQGTAIVEETVGGTVARQYLVDESGSIVELIVPSGANAGTYVVTYNGHGDAQALWRIKADGSLERANTFTYSTWGAPTITGSYPNSANGGANYGDLGFRFLYVGEFDVQWDDALGLDLTYMHARHYSPALGRFIQPDPDRSEANLYAYAANNPVTEIDPDGTCFIVCAIVNAVVDTAIYLATTDSSQWSVQGAATAAATGAVTGFLGVGLLTKVAKVGTVAKVLTKVPKASRVVIAAGRGRARPNAITVRPIRQGEKLRDLTDELKNRTFVTGREHAIVSTKQGRRVIVKGGADGMRLPTSVRRLIAHTHPYHRPPHGPSLADRAALRRLGQTHSYLLERGRVIRFGRLP